MGETIHKEKYENALLYEEFKTYDTEKIVAQTHLEAPWFYSEPGEKIDYEYAHSLEVLSETKHTFMVPTI